MHSIKYLKQLKTKKGRDESGLFIIEGEKFVQEIPMNWRIIQYVIANRYASNHDIFLYESRANCTIVKDSIFDSLADTVSPQGILAVCEQKAYDISELLGKHSPHFLLLCESLNDPGNIGALIRTAAAAGVDGIILTTGSGDIYNPKVLRAAAGAVLRMPMVTNADLTQTISLLNDKNIPTYAAHPRGEKSPYQLDLHNNFCLLVGNESHGISETAIVLAQELVTLPMANSTESLNASIAGSILMYEAVRQRRMREVGKC